MDVNFLTVNGLMLTKLDVNTVTQKLFTRVRAETFESVAKLKHFLTTARNQNYIQEGIKSRIMHDARSSQCLSSHIIF